MNMQNYLGFLTELNQALDTLTALEQRKLKAVQNNDLQTLDQCMKQEQAAALDLRGREHKRNALLKELGLEQVSLRDLPSHCPPQYKHQATEISQQVLRSYQVLSIVLGVLSLIAFVLSIGLSNKTLEAPKPAGRR